VIALMQEDLNSLCNTELADLVPDIKAEVQAVNMVVDPSGTYFNYYPSTSGSIWTLSTGRGRASDLSPGANISK